MTWGPPAPDGSITATFGDTGIGAGNFNDVFDLTFPTGTTSFTVSSTYTTDTSQDVNFTLVQFNGTDFQIGSTGQNEYRFLNDASVTSGGLQHLVIQGNSAGHGSYAGVIAFTPSGAPPGGVPEPAAWALMIVGFGGSGLVLRRRRQQLATA